MVLVSPVLSVLREYYRDSAGSPIISDSDHSVLERMSVLYVILEPCIEEGDFARDFIFVEECHHSPAALSDNLHTVLHTDGSASSRLVELRGQPNQ